MALERAAAEPAEETREDLDDDEITDDEIVGESSKTLPDAPKTMCSVLNALCAAYDSNISDEGISH